MKLVSLALAVALSPMGLAAQNAAPAPSTGNAFRFGAVTSGCPVSMQLEQRLGNQVVTVQNDGTVYKAPATQLMLTVTGLLEGSPPNGTHMQPAAHHTPLRAASATATAYGFGGQARAELVSPGQRANGSSGPPRKLQVHFNANDTSSVAELWLPSFGAVRWLELDSITWADGSSWKPAQGQSCMVTPSLFMLVGADSQAARAAR